MAVISVRLPDDLAARFDAAAADLGGRSARVRQLIAEATGPTALRNAVARGPRAGARLMVRLGSAEAAHVEREAATLQLRPAGWVAALVRRHALDRPTLARPDEVLLLAIQAEIRRIGVNVNQIARALNTAVLEGRVLELELGEISALQRELRAHVAALGEAFAGNLAYWAVDL
jgi:hypothetical protein